MVALDGDGLGLRRRAQVARRRVPPGDEERLGQLSSVEHIGHHEARESEGDSRAGVLADDGG